MCDWFLTGFSQNTLNGTWLTFSLKTLSEFPVNTLVAQCLWTLTTIIKDILKDKALPKAGTVAICDVIPARVPTRGRNVTCNLVYSSLSEEHLRSSLRRG